MNSPFPGKMTRDITTTNYRGEILEQKTDAHIGGVWYTIAREAMTYNPQGKRITSENLAGQVTTMAWGCCFACGYNEKSELTNAVEARSECQDVINRKRGRAGWITHTGQGVVVGYRECYKKIVDAIGYEPLSTVWSQFGDECPRPKIQCGCCSWSEKKGEGYTFTLGKYVHENRTVTICWNNLKRFCGGSLKKEIEARICSGECSDFDGCLKASIKSSCGYHCTESRQITDALYNDVKRWYDLKMSKPGEKGDFCKFYP